MNDNVAERITAFGSFIEKINPGRALSTGLFGFIALVLFICFESRKELISIIVAQPDIMLIPGGITVFCTILILLAKSYKTMLDKLENQHQLALDIRDRHISDLQKTVEAQRDMIRKSYVQPKEPC